MAYGSMDAVNWHIGERGQMYHSKRITFFIVFHLTTVGKHQKTRMNFTLAQRNFGSKQLHQMRLSVAHAVQIWHGCQTWLLHRSWAKRLYQRHSGNLHGGIHGRALQIMGQNGNLQANCRCFLNLFLRCCERCLDKNPSILKFILKFSFNAHKKINIQTNSHPNSGKGYGYATKTNFPLKSTYIFKWTSTLM